MKEFNEKETIEKIDAYLEVNFVQPPKNGRKKVFYGIKYLRGWRFYLKALWHRDWASIKSHIRNIYFERI